MERVDINKIVDDAMEKKDRTVTVFISGENVSVSVSPLDNTPAKWNRVLAGISKCPECGYKTNCETQYCPECGEKLSRSE